MDKGHATGLARKGGHALNSARPDSDFALLRHVSLGNSGVGGGGMEVRKEKMLPAAVLSLRGVARCRTKPESKAVGESSGRRPQKLIQRSRINNGPSMYINYMQYKETP